MSDTNTVENTVVENAPFETETEQTEQVLSETQENALQTVEPQVTPYSEEEFAALKAQSEDEDNLDPETFTQEAMKAVRDGRLTREQFEELMGMSYEDCLAELGESDQGTSTSTEEPGIGHNKPPANAANEELVEELRQYKPKDATNTAEAQERVKEAMLATVEYISQGETSLASKGAIAIADYVAFNAGLVADGNKLITVNSGMYKQILDSLSGMVDSEDAANSSFKTRVGQMIQRAILLMDGKISVGYFVLPGDRKSARLGDTALAEYPNEVPEGARVVRSTVIREGILIPMIPFVHPATKEIVKDKATPNHDAQELRLVTNEVADALYKALWDKDGELEYHPTLGRITGFKTGDQVRREIAAAEAAKAKAEAEKNAPKDAPKSRTTGGTQAEGNSLEVQNENLKVQLEQAKQDASAAVEAGKGDILSALNGLGAYIRDTSQPMPEQARVTFWRDANAMFARRLIGPNVKPSKDEMRELCKLIHNLDNHLKWDDNKGLWSFSNVDGSIVTTFGLEDEDKAA